MVVSPPPTDDSSPSSFDESERLQALRRYDILDTPPEETFDRITRLAAHHFDVPVALVTLVETGRQWFKSCYGLDRRETSREVSFCTHAIEAKGVMVVEDATNDPRFAQNPLVTNAPHIRFYAGAPLLTPDGYALGTLCIIDTEPRTIDDAAHNTLSDMANMVMDELDLRREVAERKKAEHALKESEEKYRSVTENVHDVVFRTDSDGHWTFLNGTWEKILGYTVEESLGSHFLDYLHPEEREALSDFRAILSTEDPIVTKDVRHLTKEGEVRWMRVRQQARFDKEGNITGTYGTLSDVTGNVRFETEREARRRAEELLRLKTCFLNNMSHEIRTPLTGILGFAEVLGEAVHERENEYVRQIQQNGERLLDTLNSVLDLAQLEGESLELPLHRCNLTAVVEKAVQPFRAKLQGEDVTLTFEAPPSPIHAMLSSGAIDRVLGNLLSNAIKFTYRGEITVSLRKEQGRIVLRVADTGRGISEDFIPHLFDEFRQESSGISRTHDGNGLGLAITKRLVKLMEGTIDVESTKGEGSIFIVHFPVLEDEAAMGQDLPPTNAQDIDKPQLLIVEDEPSTQKVFQAMLENDYALALTGTFDEALQQAEETDFDLLLLDVNLKERHTGVEVMHALRERPEYKDTPMIACTAYALPGDQDRFLRAGFDGYLSKPVKKERLLATLERALDEDASAPEPEEEVKIIPIDLPPLPSTLAEVMKLTSRDEDQPPDLDRLKDVLSQDPVTSSSVLQQVNSAAYSLSTKVSSIDRAVTLLGFDPVCDLVLMEALRRTFSASDAKSVRAVYRHILKVSLAAATLTREVAHFLEIDDAESAFSIGLLLQIGRLALLSRDPETYTELWEEDSETSKLIAPPAGQELLRFKVDYVQLGGLVGRQWQLSKTFIQAIHYQRKAHRYGLEYLHPLTMTAAISFAKASTFYQQEEELPLSRKAKALRVLKTLADHHHSTGEELHPFFEEQAAEARQFVDSLF